MTIDEYAEDVVGLDDFLGPSVDPQDKMMMECIIEFETEMFRLNCQQKYSRFSSKDLRHIMADIYGEGWEETI